MLWCDALFLLTSVVLCYITIIMQNYCFFPFHISCMLFLFVLLISFYISSTHWLSPRKRIWKSKSNQNTCFFSIIGIHLVLFSIFSHFTNKCIFNPITPKFIFRNVLFQCKKRGNELCSSWDYIHELSLQYYDVHKAKVKICCNGFMSISKTKQDFLTMMHGFF